MDEVEARLRVIEVSRELTTTPEVLQRMYDERLKKSGCDTNLLNLLSTWNEVPWLIEQLRLARANQKPEPVEGDEWVCLLKSVVMGDHQVIKTLTARIEELQATWEPLLAEVRANANYIPSRGFHEVLAVYENTVGRG